MDYWVPHTLLPSFFSIGVLPRGSVLLRPCTTSVLPPLPLASYWGLSCVMLELRAWTREGEQNYGDLRKGGRWLKYQRREREGEGQEGSGGRPTCFPFWPHFSNFSWRTTLMWWTFYGCVMSSLEWVTPLVSSFTHSYVQCYLWQALSHFSYPNFSLHTSILMLITSTSLYVPRSTKTLFFWASDPRGAISLRGKPLAATYLLS